MNGHRPVFWSQGLFLHPQHFQAADEEAHQRVEPLRRHGLPFFWGIRRLEINSSALDRLAVEIDALEAVLPGGAVLNAPFDCAIPPLALDRDWPEPDRTGTLYIGLALAGKSGGNAANFNGDDAASGGNAPHRGGNGKRFVLAEEPEILPDAYGCGPPAPVQRLRYAPVLLRDIDLERHTNFETMPLAKLARAGEGVAVDREFIPPLLCIGASRRLETIARELQNTAMSCAGRLAGYKPSADNGGYTADLNFVVHFAMLGILNRHIPLLEHLRGAAHAHPWRLYGALRQFAGELSSFYDHMDCLARGENGRSELPDYDHLDLAGCFEAAEALISGMIAGLGVEAARSITLAPEPPFFSAVVPEDFIAQGRKYWLTAQAPGAGEEDFARFAKLAKLGAGERMSALIAKAVSGIPLVPARTPPPGFTRSSGCRWFSVDDSHPLWEEAARNMKVILFWEEAPDNAQIQLVATGR